jgi:hypothetical protein
MKKAAFIQLWCLTVAAGRKRNFPDIRPSEAAMAMLDDRKSGLRMWRKHGAHFRSLTEEQVRAVLTGEKKAGAAQ